MCELRSGMRIERPGFGVRVLYPFANHRSHGASWGSQCGTAECSTLYVAASPYLRERPQPSTRSTVSNMTRITPIPSPSATVTTRHGAVGNNKLYIGANTCSNTVNGCLSVVNVADNTADPPFPPNGAVTSLLPINRTQRDVRHQGGYLDITAPPPIACRERSSRLPERCTASCRWIRRSLR